MPLLHHADPLPHRPQRILVAGTSGAGKTTTAALIAAALDLPRVELDALHHGPGWTVRPQFEADVHRFAAGPAWVCEWQYSSVREQLAARAELLVWLDLPRARVMRQVVRRTLRRRLRREVLWNGNVEPPLWTIFREPDHVVRWAWTSHHRGRERMAQLLRRRPELTVVRLRSRTEVARWLAGPLHAATRADDHRR